MLSILRVSYWKAFLVSLIIAFVGGSGGGGGGSFNWNLGGNDTQTTSGLFGVLFVMPYENATKGELYLVLRKNALDQGLCSYEELMLIPS